MLEPMNRGLSASICVSYEIWWSFKDFQGDFLLHVCVEHAQFSLSKSIVGYFGKLPFCCPPSFLQVLNRSKTLLVIVRGTVIITVLILLVLWVLHTCRSAFTSWVAHRTSPNWPNWNKMKSDEIRVILRQDSPNQSWSLSLSLLFCFPSVATSDWIVAIDRITSLHDFVSKFCNALARTLWRQWWNIFQCALHLGEWSLFTSLK